MSNTIRHPAGPQFIFAHARSHPKVLVGFGISVLGVLALLLLGKVWLNAT